MSDGHNPGAPTDLLWPCLQAVSKREIVEMEKNLCQFSSAFVPITNTQAVHLILVCWLWTGPTSGSVTNYWDSEYDFFSTKWQRDKVNKLLVKKVKQDKDQGDWIVENHSSDGDKSDFSGLQMLESLSSYTSE